LTVAMVTYLMQDNTRPCQAGHEKKGLELEFQPLLNVR
jgi:hypothetical protein